MTPGSHTMPADPFDPAPGAGASRPCAPDADGYRSVRRLTDELSALLSPEDQTAQSMPDVSPTKWHRAHVTWFFETFILETHDPRFRPFDPAYRMMFNSYYEGVGPKYPRAQRGVITRPGADEVGRYRSDVDERMVALLDGPVGVEPAVRSLVELGLHHEQQHQELLLMDIKHVLSLNPLAPTYRPSVVDEAATTRHARWEEFDGGLVEIGDLGGGFVFDNESPRHRVHLEPFRIADRLVTAGEWLAFIDDGGYARPDLWLSDGWYAVQSERWDAPLYWQRDAASPTGWSMHTLSGTRPVVDGEPVCHVSYYEADAYARWAGARLPTEAEWELVASCPTLGLVESFDLDRLHPAPVAPRPTASVEQLYGACWQWTASAYLPYPGFAPAAGAVGEYNGKFMSGQMVLRGSCAFTPPGHARSTYRNFFPPHARWPLTGVRLADGGAPR